MKTAVEYLCYSSERQTEQSIEGQKRVCDEYAASNDITIVHTYVDRAMTGTNDNRDDFQRMLSDSDKKTWDYVLVYKLDRFSRNKYEMAIHRKHLKDNGIKLISVMENIPDSPEGILLESLLEGMNQYYSEELSQKTKRGMNETRLKGNFIGGVLNYGYMLNGNKIVVNEDEAAILKKIFSDYAGGKRLIDIVDELNDKSILNRGNTFKPNSVYQMLGREKYTGIYRVNSITYDKVYPAIIPKNIYDTVRKRIDANKHGKHVPNLDYLLRGKVKCGYCGKALTSYTGKSVTGILYRYYKCNAIKKRTGCKSIAWKKELLEQLVFDAILKATSTNENLDFLLDKIMEKHKALAEINTTIYVLEKELSKTNKSLANIMSAIEAGIFTETTKQRLQELETLKRNLEEKILTEKCNTQKVLKREDIAAYLKKALKQKPKSVIDLLLDKVIVYNNRLSIKLKYVKEEPDNDPTYKDPDRNNSDQGLCIIRYPIEVTRTNRGGITETMILTIELLL